MKKQVNEIAAGGSTGAGSIAANPFGSEKRMSLKDFMLKFHSRLKNKAHFTLADKIVPTKFEMIGESYVDLNSVMSKLKGLERDKMDVKEVVTYGVEDDDDNIMKVSVPKHQGPQFEARLARELAEIEEYKKTGHQGKNVSMAELLYQLKDEFDILDVEFPEIPSEVVYNAEQATVGIPDSSEMTEQDDDLDLDDDSGLDNQLGDDQLGNDEDFDPEATDDSELGNNDLEDDDSVEDFGADDEEPMSSDSMLKAVLDMLRANAEAETEKAKAEAEKAREKQAEHAAAAARVELEKQEQLVGIEHEMEEQKQREKEAKKVADIARHKYQKTSDTFESFSPLFKNAICEADEFDNEAMLRRQKSMLRQKYAAQPEDTPEEREFKQKEMRNASKELDIKIRRARERTRFEKIQQDKEDQQQNNQNQQQNSNSPV